MEDILENLTEAQKDILKQFRYNLKDLLKPEHTDYVLVKYLRVREFNLKVAEKIFRENYYNRITFRVNSILDYYEKPEVARNYETYGILGFAKDGTLIRYVAAGRLDFHGFIMSMSCHDLCLYFSHMMESDIKMCKDQSLKTGKNLYEITYIFDLEGFSIQQVLHKNVIEMGLDFVRLVQDCYPEIWRRLLVVNVPKVFEKAFNLFKPVLRASALEKMTVTDKVICGYAHDCYSILTLGLHRMMFSEYSRLSLYRAYRETSKMRDISEGGSDDSTKDLLLEHIDENVLPAFLGGKRVDSNGDPYCKEFIIFGGKVPEKFYARNARIPLSPTDPDVRSIYIGPRSVYNIIHVAPEEGTKARLQMKSESGSVYLAAFYKEIGPDTDVSDLPGENEYLDEADENCKFKQISVELRTQCHCTQEDALVYLPWPGIYVIRFNNSSNWFTGRKLLLKYEVFPPKKEVAS